MKQSPFLPKFSELPDTLAVFPLAGAMLMPKVQLPLNVFEPRYLNMVVDVLAGDHLIGMIQPLAEADPAAVPPMHKVGCAGRVTSYSETDDGRILLVLSGVCRFEIRSELEPRRGYRRVVPSWERFAIDFHEDTRLADRDSFLSSLRSYTRLKGVEIPWDGIDKMGDSDLVNLLCAHLPLEPEDKQALIETLHLRDRTELMRALMDMSVVSNASGVERRH